MLFVPLVKLCVNLTDSSFAYNATPSNGNKDFIEGATWDNGVLHVPGWFDLKMYAQTSYNEDAEEWAFTYYLYL